MARNMHGIEQTTSIENAIRLNIKPRFPPKLQCGASASLLHSVRARAPTRQMVVGVLQCQCLEGAGSRELDKHLEGTNEGH